eukprot:345485-Amphidinium_carterae.1
MLVSWYRSAEIEACCCSAMLSLREPVSKGVHQEVVVEVPTAAEEVLPWARPLARLPGTLE